MAQSSGNPGTVTRFLVWSLVGLFFCQLFSFGAALDQRLGLSQGGLDHGRWWTLVTYAWLHTERGLPWYLLWSLLSIRFLAPPVEAALGRRKFLGLYLLSVAVAGLAWVISARPGALLMGASGAVFGLAAAYGKVGGASLLSRFAVAFTFRAALVFEFLCLLFGWLPGTAHWAHLGGAFGGWWFMRLWGPAEQPQGGNPFFQARVFRTGGTQARAEARPEEAPSARPEREIPADDSLFSNYNSTPQPPEER
ncbi:MAG TPA: rhomboid family intramembrane serine protease [Candidatus Methylacidiphilales bacterium]